MLQPKHSNLLIPPCSPVINSNRLSQKDAYDHSEYSHQQQRQQQQQQQPQPQPQPIPINTVFHPIFFTKKKHRCFFPRVVLFKSTLSNRSLRSKKCIQETFSLLFWGPAPWSKTTHWTFTARGTSNLAFPKADVLEHGDVVSEVYRLRRSNCGLLLKRWTLLKFYQYVNI